MAMDASTQAVARYYFKTPDGAVYGPVDVATLCTWAADARVIPGCTLSTDQADWFPVETVPELRLNWSVKFSDGTTYGPLNLLAVWLLAAELSIPRGVTLVETGSQRTMILDDTLIPLLVEECRQVLSGCGVLMGQMASAQQKAQLEASRVLADRDSHLAKLQAKQEAAEGELAINLKLVAESQRRLAEVEPRAARLDDCVRQCEALQSELAEVRKDRSTDQTLCDDLTRQLQDEKTRVARIEAELESLRQELVAEQVRTRKGTGDADALRLELEQMAVRLQETLSDHQALEGQLRQQEATLALFREESRKQEDALLARCSALEKERDGEKRKVEDLSSLLAQARAATAKAQKAERSAEQKLQDETAVIQRDLNNMMLASRCVKQMAGLIKPKPTPIDWMNAPFGDREENANDLEARFSRLTLNEKLVVLQKELQASAEEKNLLRQELQNLKGRFEFLQKEAARKEQEASERLVLIQKEIKTSSDLLAKTMQEVEKRESQLRLLRKKSDERGRDPGKRPTLDAEVIHAEVLGLDESGTPTPDPVVIRAEPKTEARIDPPKGSGILNGVEAQLKSELRKWETLKREKENKGGTFSKWFRRKQP